MISIFFALIMMSCFYCGFCVIPSLTKLSSKLNLQVVKSGALAFAPWVKLHHIVVLKDIVEPYCGAYTIDYSPINQRSPSTLAQLLFGLNVPAEIRIRFLNGSNIDINDVKDRPECSDVIIVNKERFRITPSRNRIAFDSNNNYPSFSPAMEQLIQEVTEKWRSKMNLYVHNCQHFSGFIKKVVKTC